MTKEATKTATKEEIKDNGIKSVLDKALESYEKLPMLEIVFDRLVRMLTTSLRNFTSETVDINTKEYSSMRFGAYMQNVKPPSSIVVFKVIEWENLGLIVIDRQLVYTLIDLLLGGKKNENKDSQVPERTFTDIEQSLIKQVAEVVLNELSTSFDPISPATCVMERFETNPYFATITRQSDAIIMLKLNVKLDERGGTIDIVIPYSTLEPIKDMLQQIFIGEKFGSDAEWEENILNQAMFVDLPIETVIINKPTLLKNVFNLKPGDTIITDNLEDDPVLVRCENVNLFKGKIGKIGDKIAVDLMEEIFEERKS